jgi:SAM-dependent methyltransferase
MGFSAQWDSVYKTGRQQSIWPWTDLVSYVMRYAKPYKTPFRVLELGCGAGANIPFFKNLNVEYYALEGSSSIIKQLHQSYPEYKDHILVDDFTIRIPFIEKFDLIVDRASLTHNNTKAIKKCISLIKSHLVSQGVFIGIDWFSTEHTEFANGIFNGDHNTKSDFSSGQFKDVGKTHFSDKNHIIELFDEFEIILLEHKIVTREIPIEKYKFASFNFIAKNNDEYL